MRREFQLLKSTVKDVVQLLVDSNVSQAKNISIKPVDLLKNRTKF